MPPGRRFAAWQSCVRHGNLHDDRRQVLFQGEEERSPARWTGKGAGAVSRAFVARKRLLPLQLAVTPSCGQRLIGSLLITMDDIAIARALHVIGVVLWIGGVGFVTTVLLPGIRRMREPQDRVAFFERLERSFAWQARLTTLVVGISGFYMTTAWNLWSRFASPVYWWMHAMVLVWAVFTVMLFVAEPLFLHRWFIRRAQARPEATFRLIESLHRVLLVISILTVLGAVSGSHGIGFI